MTFQNLLVHSMEFESPMQFRQLVRQHAIVLEWLPRFAACTLWGLSHFTYLLTSRLLPPRIHNFMPLCLKTLQGDVKSKGVFVSPQNVAKRKS